MAKRIIYRRAPTSAEPLIGIFWVYQGQIVMFSEPASSVASAGGFKDSALTHDGYWGQMQKQFPELAGKEYFDIPRGRVVGNVSGNFIINLGSKQAANPILLARIMQTFALPRDKTSVQVDDHYNPPALADMEPN